MSRNTKPLPFFRPSIGRAEIRAVTRVMRSGWLTTGPEALAFEKEFAAFINARSPAGSTPLQALAVNSATSGLHLSLEAAGVGAGDCVAVPSLTFTATAEVVRYLGAHPVFIDSHPRTGNMDAESLAKARKACRRRGKRIKAVIPVHLAGKICAMDELREVVKEDEAVFIEDAAHALPSSSPAGMAGSLGDAGVFSFYATKTITTGEGGMVVSRNSGWMDRMRIMRLHGIDRAVWNRYNSKAPANSWVYDVTAPGYKYNMTDMAAAIGRVQLQRAREFHSKRLKRVREYSRLLSGLPNLTLPEGGKDEAWHLYIVCFKEPRTRGEAAEALARAGTGTSVHFIPLHQMSCWKNTYGLLPEDFPNAEYLGSRILSLPLWPDMPMAALRRTAEILREVVSRA